MEISYQNTWYNNRNDNDGYFAVINFAEGQKILQGSVAVNKYESIGYLLIALKEELRLQKVGASSTLKSKI